MKLFLGHLFGFGMMFGLCFLSLSGLLLIVPVISAFITWELDPLNIGLPTVLLWVRVIIVFSAFMGIVFTSSQEGRSLARDFANGY